MPWQWRHCPLAHRYSGFRIILTLQSNCKINIGLKITGKRADGYHTLETIFQEIDLADTIFLETIDEGWQLTCSDSAVPVDETNLCVKTFFQLKKLFPGLGGVGMRLQKRIPAGAGLGGGSANAGALLKGINELYQLELPDNRLEDIALTIGSDVPFFIRGGTQYAEGVGEILSDLTLPPIGAILLVIPQIRISTKWAYNGIKNNLTGGVKSGKFAAALESFDSWQSVSFWETADKFFKNDFESLVFQTYPEIGDIQRQLLDAGALFASLSGSGSTVFGIFRDDAQALKAQAFFSFPLLTFITHSILKGDFPKKWDVV